MLYNFAMCFETCFLILKLTLQFVSLLGHLFQGWEKVGGGRGVGSVWWLGRWDEEERGVVGA